MSETSMDEIRKSLKKELDKSRYEHTMGVMYTAAALAMAHGVDQKKRCLPDFFTTAQNVFQMRKRWNCVKNIISN